MRSLRLLLLALAIHGTLPAASAVDTKDLLIPSLVADTGAVVAGQPFTVGLLLKMKPGWHTYWEYSGETGTPISVTWELPEGFKAGPLQWPVPKSELEGGELQSYVYEDETMLMATITPPAKLPAGESLLKARLAWQICGAICIQNKGEVELKIPQGETPSAANGQLFAKWHAQLPKPNAPFPVKWETANPKEVRLTVSGLSAEMKAEFFPLPPKGAMAGHPSIAPPAADGSRLVAVPITTPAPGAWSGLLVTQKGDQSREGWVVSAAATSPSVSPAMTKGASTGGAPPPSFLAMLLSAFLGGLLLNIMPCVLPVIALKVYGFIHQSHQDPARVFRLGLAFVAGVFTFFLGLATAVAILGRAFHLGFQFQNPYALAVMVSLVFVFGLNLLGVFEFTLSSGATSTLSNLSGQEGYHGAFLHGLFTTLLGTSCTAPLVGSALAYATTQSLPAIYLLFITIAAGVSLPYFLLTSNPALLRFLPKPGAWMERFKQGMGFLMLAIAVWLFTVFAVRGQEAITSLAWFLFVLAAACWLYGVIPRRGIGAGLALLAVVGGYLWLLWGQLGNAPRAASTGSSVTVGGVTWQPFSEQGLQAALTQNKPVFIDFTADWCPNCKFFERTVLASDPIAQSLREKGVVTMRADWTVQDETITKHLNQFGGAGVPLYVLFRPGESQPLVQEGLTRGGLLDELAKIEKK